VTVTTEPIYGTAADLYWERGWRGVLPIPYLKKDPPPPGYTGHNGIDPSYPDVTTWKETRPRDNLAIRVPDDVMGIDVDNYGTKVGATTIAELEKGYGRLPPTHRSTSRTDGVSGIRLYRVPSGSRFRDPGGDVEIVQHTHRYAMVWPSVHPNGARYQWIDEATSTVMDGPPRVDDIPQLPPGWLAGLNPRPDGDRTTAPGSCDVRESLTEGDPAGRVAKRLTDALGDVNGSRHNHTRDHVLALLRFGKDGDPGVKKALETVMAAFVNTVTTDGSRTWNEATAEFRRFITNPRAAQLLAEPSSTGTGTGDAIVHGGQLGMAHLLAEMYPNKFRYVRGLGWFGWDGKRYKPGSDAAVRRAVHALLKRERVTAAKLWGKETDERLRQIVRLENANAISGIITDAAVLPRYSVDVDQLDADPHLLNTSTCTIDLRTGEDRPHDPHDLITKVTRAGYDRTACGPNWSAFVEKVLPYKDIREYLQRVSGVALVGRVTEHILPILTGIGANGKTTFCSAFEFALGDYASTVDPDLFMERKSNHPTSEMGLRGLRLAIVSESGRGRALDEPRVKRLTGGDTITARYLYSDFVSFSASHTAFLTTNHLPRVSGDDDAIWRRVRLIPFTVVVSDADRDGYLGAKLEAEADAVLTWAVNGWIDYQARGYRLDEPQGVLVATGKYRNDSDDVGRFLADEQWVRQAPTLKATTTEMHKGFLRWAAQEGADEVSLKGFGMELDRVGFPVTQRTSTARYRDGIALCEIDGCRDA
jgi:putative DNA primase/helicase